MTTVKLIKHSTGNGIEMLTYECEIPRIILAELNTHKMLCRNTQSNRAIPVEKYIEEIKKNPYIPKHWGAAQKGMQADEECNNEVRVPMYGLEVDRLKAYQYVLDESLEHAKMFADAGYHKQIVNRLIENFSYIKIIISGTEWNNFFNLRIHRDAEPNIRELAVKMYLAKQQSTPQELFPGEWHLPYIKTVRKGRSLDYYSLNGRFLSTDEAIKISLASIAQVSYRKMDQEDEVVNRIYNKLFPENGPVHASPAEHIATPMCIPLARCYDSPLEFSSGISHRCCDGYYWSGQLRGWIQKRKLINNENCTRFSKETFNKRLMEFKHNYI